MKRTRHSGLIVASILILASAGAWISGELVKRHSNLWDAAPAQAGLFARVCQAVEGAGLSCTGAGGGNWKAVSVPILLPSARTLVEVRTVSIPVAFLGLAYFVFLGVWFALLGRPRPHGRGWHKVPLSVAFGGAAFSLFFVGVMASISALVPRPTPLEPSNAAPTVCL